MRITTSFCPSPSPRPLLLIFLLFFIALFLSVHCTTSPSRYFSLRLHFIIILFFPVVQGNPEYYVKWKGHWPGHEYSWEPAENMAGSRVLIEAFLKREVCVCVK